ncbi:MAG: FtsX-like permease family protein [Anaerolineaceae bacterium]|nr:FtsX-like permease family protein [Anaerolineaceae bacterium]
MNILTTYTLKYLRLNQKRTAVTILGVILSAALICGVFLLGVSFQKVMIDHEIYMSGNWHAQFHAVPYDKAKYITENNAVQTALLSQSLGSATYGSHNTVRPYLYVTAYDALSFQNHSIQLISGRLPQNGDELLVSPVMIKDSGLGLKPGSTLELAFVRRDIPDYDGHVKAWGSEENVALVDGETLIPSASRTYTVVGVMKPLSDETSMPAAFPALTYLDPAQLAATDKVDIAILARDPRSLSTRAPEMARSAGLDVVPAPDGKLKSITYNEELLPWLGGSGRSNYIQSFLLIIAFLISLIVCGSALLIYNAFAISISERKKQFGMFASVGATSVQIRRIVLTEAGVIAAIGIPLGILGAIAGVGILVKLTQGMVSQLILDAEQGLPLVVSPLIIGLTVLFSAATILLSAWIPARRASRVSPIDAIRQSGEIQAESKPLNLRTSPLIRRVFGFEGELALKSLQRDRKRYLTTLLSLMISIILFVAFNALRLYTDKTTSLAVQAMNYDLQIDLDYRQTHAMQFADQVGQLPEVQRVSYVRCSHEAYIPPRAMITDPAYQALQEMTKLNLEYLPSPVEGDTYEFVIKMCTVGPSEFAHYAAQLGLDVQQFSDPSNPMGILINHNTLRKAGKLYEFDLFNLKPGDTMTATKMSVWTSPDTESTAPASLTWTVGAVTQENPLGIMGGTEMIVSDVVFDALSDRMLQLGPIAQGPMSVKSDDPDAAVEAIERLYKATVGGNFSYNSMKDFNQSQTLQTLMTNLFFYGFLALITLIGVTNIVNTLDTNIKLRRREIAMLKSVGLTPGGFLRMLRYESLFYGLTALLYGLPIGIALSYLIYTQFGGVIYFAFSLPWGAIASAVVGILVIVFATMMVSGAMIRNDNIVDTIKEENL